MAGWGIFMPQFMIKSDLAVGHQVKIEKDDAHHIIEVLRLKIGEWIVLSDGKGHRFKGEINSVGKKSVDIHIKEKLMDIGNTGITLAQAIIKKDGVEDIIQKAVELGVTEIIPFFSERSIPKFTLEAMVKKVERWNKIALEASKQCGLSILPKVRPIKKLGDIIKNSDQFANKILFYEGEKNDSLGKHISKASKCDSTIIIIGPEGGFSAGEVQMAKACGFATVSLGPLILRVETAAITGITLTQYFLGHFDLA